MRKVAIIIHDYRYYNYGDDYDSIVKQITDWSEISDEDYQILVQVSRTEGFSVIEQPIDQTAFIHKKVEDYIEAAKQKQIKEAEAKKKRAQAAAEKKLKKDLKDKENKLELYKKLQEELGIQNP